MTDRIIFLVDMQSFYASVEKAARPEYRDKPVIIAGDPAKRSGIVLAACPLAKAYGISATEWVGEAVKKCADLIVLQPRMQEYINVSLQITAILERYSDLVEPFSIDEQFIDVTPCLKLFGEPETIARMIQDDIGKETGVYARVGIGPNKVLAKIACDNFAKKRPGGIFTLTHDNMREEMWKLPIAAMFGVGTRMARHLHRLGVLTIGDLAQFPLERLQHIWGIPGHVLWMTANGIDYSPVTPSSHDHQKAVGHHMTLPRDYHLLAEIETVLLELSEEVCRRARSKGLMGSTIAVGCRGASFERPTGFYRQTTLPDPTSHAPEVFAAVRELFVRHWDNEPVRSVGVTLTQLQPDDTYQLELFRDREKERRLACVMDAIKDKYGSASIVRAVSATLAGQAYERAAKIGGHYK